MEWNPSSADFQILHILWYHYATGITEDEAIWDEEGEEAEDPEDAINYEFETESEAEESECSSESEGSFLNHKSEKVNDQQYLFYVYGI